MDSRSHLNSFYDALHESIQRGSVTFVPEDIQKSLEITKLFKEPALGYLQIMITSWAEFLKNLFERGSTESLLSNLHNHILFLKNLNPEVIPSQLDIFIALSEKLIKYILAKKLIIQFTPEMEEEYREFEFDLYLFDRRLDLGDLLLYILKKNKTEINITTKNHIIKVIESLLKKDPDEFRHQLYEIKAIQETIHTILQLDRKDSPSPLIIKLKKEFELINEFYALLNSIVHYSAYENFKEIVSEFRTSYDYPFLDVIKNLLKLLQSYDETFLIKSSEIIRFIQSKKPFRKQDIQFLENTMMLFEIVEEYFILQKNDLQFPMDSFLAILKDVNLSWELKFSVAHLSRHITLYQKFLIQKFDRCLQFFLKICNNRSIALLYRKKIFNAIAFITRELLKNEVISRQYAKKYVSLLKRVASVLRNQPLKKLEKFQEISYRLPDRFHFHEFESGLCIQLLYGLEDFQDWTDGKKLQTLLRQSSFKSDSRYQFLDHLYKIADEISEFSDSDGDSGELQHIEPGMVKKLLMKAIAEHYPPIPDNLKKFYAALTVHTINLSSESEKISPDERDELVLKFREFYRVNFRGEEVPMAIGSVDDIFSENYDKEFSSYINLYNFYIPILCMSIGDKELVTQ